MPELDAPDPFVASDSGLTPDPSFWSAPPRRRAGRRPGIAERVAAAIPSRDARTAIAAVVAVLIITTVLVSYRASSPPGPPGTPGATAASRSPSTPSHARAAAATPRRVVVHVAGAVTRPGVVTLSGGSRVIDAIDTAGGALATANLDAINLAARLRDGQQILVPSTGSTPTTAPPATAVPNPTPAPTG